MKTIDTIDALEVLYDAPLPSPLHKVQNAFTPSEKAWIGQSRFAVPTTVGPEETDASPREDRGPAAPISCDPAPLSPDGRGSLMFIVPGCMNDFRVSGSPVLSGNRALPEQFDTNDKMPKR